jgi:hypothetical protein
MTERNEPVRVAPIVWRMIAWSFVSTLAIASAVFMICLKAGPNQWGLSALLWTLLSVNLALMFWWFYGALRRAGYPVTFAVSLRLWQVTAVYGAALIAAIVLTDFMYRWTGSRLLEGLVALFFAPLAVVFVKRSYALQPAPKPQEAGMLRRSYILYFVLPAIFGGSLIEQLQPPLYYDAALVAKREWTIAAFFVLLFALPISGYFMRKRYLRAAARSPVT